MRRSRQKGFTLLELLVAVAILGALAGIAIPQYSAYKSKAEIASVLSNCRSLYRATTLFYLEQNYQYPSQPSDNNVDSVDLIGNVEDEFYPMSRPSFLGGVSFEIDINQLRKSLGGDAALKAKRKYVTDVNYQQFYFVLPWHKDPTLQFVVATSDNVLDVDNKPIDSGNWLDGVFVWQDGKVLYR